MLYRDIVGPSVRQLNFLQERLNKLFTEPSDSRQAEFPPINVWASDGKAIVVAEMPGVDSDDIDLQIVNQTLTLKTKREPEQLREGETLHRQERGYGQFARSLELPYAIDADKAQASFKHGLLRVELPRAAADSPRKISICPN